MNCIKEYIKPDNLEEYEYISSSYSNILLTNAEESLAITTESFVKEKKYKLSNLHALDEVNFFI